MREGLTSAEGMASAEGRRRVHWRAGPAASACILVNGDGAAEGAEPGDLALARAWFEEGDGWQVVGTAENPEDEAPGECSYMEYSD